MMVSSRLQIAIIADHFDINGGAGRVACETALGLAESGHDVTVLSGTSHIDPRLRTAPVRLVVLNGLNGAPEGRLQQVTQAIWNARAARSLAEELSRFDRSRSVVHLHAWGQALSPSIASAIRASGLPGVMTLHDYLSVCPNGNFYDFRREQVCSLKPMSLSCITTNCDRHGHLRKTLRVARTVAARWVGKLFDACPDVVVLSQLQQAVVSAHAPPHVRFHRIDNPVDCLNVGPKTSGLGTAFLYVGRFTEEKGVVLFARAAAMAGVPAIFVGDGPELDAIRTVNPDAEIRGWLGPDGVRSAMREARALVLPSLWFEGQPLTVLEALSLGTPVIVSGECAGREAVRHGENGLIFRSGDVGDLVRHLQQLRNEEETCLRFSRNAYESFWANPPTREAHVLRLEALYAQILGAGGSQAP